MSKALAEKDKDKTEYTIVPFQSNKPFRLSIAVVKAAIAVPTKSGRQCTDRDAYRFIMMCQARGLNPWEGDAFLIGYDKRTENGIVAEFSLITAVQALQKRAEVHP